MNDDQRLLAQVPLFSALSPDALHQLATMLHTQEAPAGMILFQEGDHGDHFYIVCQGEIEVIKALGTPDEQIIAVRQPGEFIGEMSLFNQDGLRTASVRTRTPARLWVMTRYDFDELLHRYPRLAYEMVRVQSQRLSAAHNNALRHLMAKNRELQAAYDELRSAQAQIIEKEKLEKELQVAARIQASILPHTLPQLPGYDFGAHILPARAVGGDWFDFIPLDDTQLGIVVGDVSDKGVPAALFMAQAHALLRAAAGATIAPRQTLERVNQQLQQLGAAGLFAAVLYGILNYATGEFRYARAGHELPLLSLPDGTLFTPPLGQGHVLGLWPAPALDEQSVSLPSGATLLLFTDGVTECRNPAHDFFGSERLAAKLQALTAQSGQAVCDDILRTLLEFQGTAPQQDDITLVAVHAH